MAVTSPQPTNWGGERNGRETLATESSGVFDYRTVTIPVTKRMRTMTPMSIQPCVVIRTPP
jgi:hypothetical protein